MSPLSVTRSKLKKPSENKLEIRIKNSVRCGIYASYWFTWNAFVNIWDSTFAANTLKIPY